MGKTRLHTPCHFHSAVVIKAYLTIWPVHLFFTNMGCWLGTSSRFDKQARPIALPQDRKLDFHPLSSTHHLRFLEIDSRIIWPLVFWCLLTWTLQVTWCSASANQYNYNRSSPAANQYSYNRSSPDTLTTQNTLLMLERVWNNLFKKYPQFQVKFSKIDGCI